jgi:CelD/BcsL family acetyltransferase involved in cellulose biosynthesis
MASRMDQAVARYECSLIEDVGDFVALKGEWESLHSGLRDGYLSQGFDWALCCWKKVAREHQAQLRCFVVRAHGRLVALLPMTVSKTRLGRVAKPLASPTIEYCPLLFDPSADVGRVWIALRAELGRWGGGIDAVLLSNVRGDSALGLWLQGCPAATWIRSLPAPLVRTADFTDWESYRNQLPHKVQTNLRRNWKRIQKLGEVKFEELTDREEVQAAWRWMIVHKREWVARKRIWSSYIPLDDYFHFTAATLDIDGHAGRRSILALKLNGQLIAAELVDVDRQRVEMFVTVYDAAFAQFAPGNLLRGEALRWAFAQGLDYDLRSGDDAYKFEWANYTTDCATYVLALNMKGRIFASYLAFRQWTADRTPEALRAKIRSWLSASYMGQRW